MRRTTLPISATIIIYLLAAITVLVACTPNTQQSSVINVGIIFGTGGLGDRSFNDSAYNGLLEAQKRYNIRFESVDYASQQSNLDALRLFARNNYDLIIGIGFENQENVLTVAKEFPEVQFALVDVAASGNNVASIVYREHEADFLMGVLAAMLTKTRTVGLIGGMETDAIKRIAQGFRQGVAHQDSGVKVLVDNAGTFSDPEKGRALALAQYAGGADLIHNAAGRTGLGIIEAAKEAGKLTTGTSGDQRYLAPGNVVGNRPKRVDTAVLAFIEGIRDGTFKSGTRSLGLRDHGISLGPFDELLVSKAMLNRLEELQQKIVNNEIVVSAE